MKRMLIFFILLFLLVKVFPDEKKELTANLNQGISKKNLELVKETFQRLSDLNEKPDLTSLLHQAVLHSNNEIINFLIENGADPNTPYGYHQERPLYAALKQWREGSIIRNLLQKGAIIDQKALNEAAGGGGKALNLEILLEYLTETRLLNEALAFAVKYPSNETRIKMLLDSGADVQSRHTVSFYEKNRTVSWTPIMLASREIGSEEVIGLLLKYGALVEDDDEEGTTPLLIAVKNNAKKNISVLLKHGADIHHRDKNGRNVLDLVPKIQKPTLINGKYTTMELENEEIFFLLINEGADFKGQDISSKTLIAALSMVYKTDILLKLIESGINTRATDKYGITPLVKMIKDEKEPVLLEAAIRAGSEVNAKDSSGTPVLMLLLQKAKNNNRYIGAINLVLEHGADVNCTDSDGLSPLLLSIRENLPEIAFQLLKKNADTRIVDKSGKTLLMFAIQSGNSELAIHLLKKTSDVRAVDPFGNTPLLYAAFFTDNNALMDALMSSGSDIHHRNHFGATPLLLARLAGHTGTEKYLSEKSADSGALRKELLRDFVTSLEKKEWNNLGKFFSTGVLYEEVVFHTVRQKGFTSAETMSVLQSISRAKYQLSVEIGFLASIRISEENGMNDYQFLFIIQNEKPVLYKIIHHVGI
ncbi:MAG: ankyrin repeat domain-containing protein [Spirochaetales bacterium]|nr:ankyrin repeat domain-containing protein [Spirochaetales bacterium]